MPLRPLAVDDADELAAFVRDTRDSVAGVSPIRDESYYTEPGQADILRGLAADAAAGRAHGFAIVDDAGAMIGTITLDGIVRRAAQWGWIGYSVHPDAEGRGVATGAVADLVRFAFDELRLHMLNAGTVPDNRASQRVLAKNGFTQYGLSRQHLRVAGRWQDHALFQLINPACTP